MTGLFAALAAFAFLMLLLLRNIGPLQRTSPYVRRITLFTPAETRFMRVLDRATGPRYRIFAKVRIADVIDLREGIAPAWRRKAFHRICARHFDFVMCRSDDLSILGVIELNDASHQRRDRARRDRFIIAVCNAIGLPILLVRARHDYDAAELRRVLVQAFMKA